MSLEMGENQKRIIIRKVFSYKVLLNDFAVRDRKLQIRSFRIQKIDFKVPAPSMCLQRLFVLGGVLRSPSYAVLHSTTVPPT